ncbi:lyase domain-containing protein [Phthorimaea operculella]|nr:lyase domain-containing protein [Phthorimaea operculella]
MSSDKDCYQLWGGCFEEEPSAVLRRLNDSLGVDVRLYREDIHGSRCWARELHRSGHLGDQDHQAIQQGLDKVETEIKEELASAGRLQDPEEDIHSVVERRLFAHAGDSALRLHTARSRNDQSATDTRLWMLAALPAARVALRDLISAVDARGAACHAGRVEGPHLARSRNDQSATDTRLWMLAALPAARAALRDLISVSSRSRGLLMLHTARSSNDQSATDTRLWMLAALPAARAALRDLISVSSRSRGLPDAAHSAQQQRPVCY